MAVASDWDGRVGGLIRKGEIGEQNGAWTKRIKVETELVGAWLHGAEVLAHGRLHADAGPETKNEREFACLVQPLGAER